MAKKDSNRIKEAGDIVTACVGLASLIFTDITAVHILFGILLLVWWFPKLNRPYSVRERVILSLAMSLAFILFISYPLNLILNHYGMAQSWDIVLLTLGIIVAACFFVIKSLFELR